MLGDWNEFDLSRGDPRCMDTPTLIEWLQRELDPPEVTATRLLNLKMIQLVLMVPASIGSQVLTPNETRQIQIASPNFDHIRF